jgi:hypothetical protein
MRDPFGPASDSRDATAAVATVVDDAKRLYQLADDAALEQCARQAVAELWGDSIKVTAFVPLLALRRVRETLAATGPDG